MLGTFHIVLAMKPTALNFADNALQVGIAGLNMEACRIPITNGEVPIGSGHGSAKSNYEQVRKSLGRGENNFTPATGRWPANVIHDGSEEIIALFPETGGNFREAKANGKTSIWGSGESGVATSPDDSGSNARFFFAVKSC